VSLLLAIDLSACTLQLTRRRWQGKPAVENVSSVAAANPESQFS